MIHLIFDRPNATIKAYDAIGSLYGAWPGGGDTWGAHGVSCDGAAPEPPWGHDCPTPPGHYVLGPPEFFDPPIASEGFGQIPVSDMDSDSLAALVKAGRAVANGLSVDIGGTTLPIGQLGKYGRSAILVHCGGSNAPDPFADDQGLYRTCGCTRMLNKDWRTLANWLKPQYDGNTVVFSVIGDPVTLED